MEQLQLCEVKLQLRRAELQLYEVKLKLHRAELQLYEVKLQLRWDGAACLDSQVSADFGMERHVNPGSIDLGQCCCFTSSSIDFDDFSIRT